MPLKSYNKKLSYIPSPFFIADQLFVDNKKKTQKIIKINLENEVSSDIKKKFPIYKHVSIDIF